MKQSALTVLLPISPGKESELKQVLGEVGQDITGNPYLQFPRSPITHFARFVVLDDGAEGGSRLYFSSNFDGDRSAYLHDLAARFGGTMAPIWLPCEGYTPGCCADSDAFARYVLRHAIPEQTFYVAFRSRTVQEIQDSLRDEESLQSELDTLSLKEQPPGQRPPGRLARSAPPSPSTGLLARLWPWITGRLEWLVGIRDRPDSEAPQYETSNELFAIEDVVVQNQMTVIVTVKRRWLSQVLLRIVLFAINTAARFARGPIVGLSQIHFARWVLIDHGARLLFDSNYDGSWESYIDDFIDHASFGLNMIWGNTIEFPPGGVRDTEAFKKSIRDNQIPAQVFYSAYPFATIPNILNALAVKGSASGSPVRRALDSGYYPSPH